MCELFIEDLVKVTGLIKRQIYNLLRRKDFYRKCRIIKMDLPGGTNNGLVSKVLAKEQVKHSFSRILFGTNCD